MTTQDIGLTSPSQPVTPVAIPVAQTGPLPPPTQGVTVTQARELTQEQRNTWERLRSIKDQIKELKEQEEELTGQLRMTLGLGEFAVNGTKVFGITENKRWNEDQARQVLAAYPQILAQITVERLDANKAKELLSPAWYELCQAEVGQHKVAPVTRRSS